LIVDGEGLCNLLDLRDLLKWVTQLLRFCCYVMTTPPRRSVEYAPVTRYSLAYRRSAWRLGCLVIE